MEGLTPSQGTSYGPALCCCCSVVTEDLSLQDSLFGPSNCFLNDRKEQHLLLCERAQQNATMVAISTRNATPAPTATPMITAIGTDSAKGTRVQMKCRSVWALLPLPSLAVPAAKTLTCR